MDVSDLEDLFEPFGNVTVRRMFGGIGVFHRGLNFAGVMDGVFTFKADEQTIPEFEAEGSKVWQYTRKDGKIVTMPYWSVPERLLDDEDEFLLWARRAFEAAVRADQAKPPSQRKLAEF